MKAIAVLQDDGFRMFTSSSYIILKGNKLMFQDGIYTQSYPSPIEGGFIYDMEQVAEILRECPGTFITLYVSSPEFDAGETETKLWIIYASTRKYQLKSRYHSDSNEIVKLAGGRTTKTTSSEIYRMGEMTATNIEGVWTFVLNGTEVPTKQGQDWIFNTYKISDLKFLSRKVDPEVRQKRVSGPKVEVKSQIVKLHKCGTQFALGKIMDIGGINRGYIMLWSDGSAYHKIQHRESNASKIFYIAGLEYNKRFDIDTNLAKLEYNDGEILLQEFPSTNLCINPKLQFELVRGESKIILDVFGIGGQIKLQDKVGKEWVKRNVTDVKVASFLIECGWGVNSNAPLLDNVISFFESKGFIY
jgi:hypothetical protein